MTTENGNSATTEKGKVSLTIEASPTIEINAYGITQSTKDLLSVAEIVRKQGLLVIKAEGAYRLPDQIFTVLKLRQKVRSVRKGYTW